MKISHSSKILYENEINGLRAIAIILVLFFHLNISLFPGGFVGVDIFFVISGYLITKLIQKELNSNKFNLMSFYIKRLKRILPATIILITFVTFLAIIILSSGHLKKFSISAISSIFFLSNFFFWTESNYFNISSNFKPLLHTWSLGVEFFFYLTWPLLLKYSLKKNKNPLNLIIIIFCLSLSMAIFLINKGDVFENKILYGILVSDTAFYIPLFRFYEFMLGAIIANKNLNLKNNILKELMFFCGLALILISAVTFTELTKFPGTNALYPCIGTCLIIISKKTKYSDYLLNNRPIKIIGLTSFSIYLYHWPIIVFYKYIYFDLINLNHKIIIIIVVAILSYLSFNFIEEPFRKSKIKLIHILYLLITVLIINLYVVKENGLNWKIKNSEKYNSIINNKENISGGSCAELGDINIIMIGEKCIYNPKNKNKFDFILIGDSHGQAYFAGLYELSKKHDLSFISLNKYCNRFPYLDSNIIDCTEEIPFSDTIILGSKFYDYQFKSDELDKIGKQYSDKIFELFLNNKLSHIKKIIIFGQVPELQTSYGDVKSCLERPDYIKNFKNCEKYFNNDIDNLHKKFFLGKKKLNDEINKNLSKNEKYRNKVVFIDPIEYFCNEDKCKRIVNNNIIYSDPTHLSVFGSKEIIRYFEEKLINNIKKSNFNLFINFN